VCLFASVDWRENVLEKGFYRKRLCIPAQTFAEGRTHLLAQAVFYDPHVRSVYLPDVLSFECVESNHKDAVRGAYLGQWPGLVRLGLKWSDADNINTYSALQG
jgi:hypothetical protein